LLQTSVADALEAHDPFVLAFATPALCTSRICGPTLEVVDAVRQQLAGEGVRFIHAEVYEQDDPAKGWNRWMREWNLSSEPWIFVVDGAGVIQAKFEGFVSVNELAATVRRELLAG
jgi:hypothetical protein